MLSRFFRKMFSFFSYFIQTNIFCVFLNTMLQMIHFSAMMYCPLFTEGFAAGIINFLYLSQYSISVDKFFSLPVLSALFRKRFHCSETLFILLSFIFCFYYWHSRSADKFFGFPVLSSIFKSCIFIFATFFWLLSLYILFHNTSVEVCISILSGV